MSFGFPANPSNKKQYVTTDGKSYEYDSTRGAWAVGIRPASSANTVNITDVSQLVDPDNLLDNPGSTLPVYATEESLYASTADLDVGQMAYVSENGKIAIWNGTGWLGATTIEYIPPPPFGWGGDRAVAQYGTTSNSGFGTLSYFDITNIQPTVSSFGNLTVNRHYNSAVSNKTRGVWAGGYASDAVGRTDRIDYVTISTPGNAQVFGNLTSARTSTGSASDGTYGIWGSGETDGAYPATYDYISFDTIGNASAGGALSQNASRPDGLNDATRAVFNKGSGTTNQMSYITMATLSDSAVFGTLSVQGYGRGTCSSNTYGLFAGGRDNSSFANIEYITIATIGNASNFGNLLNNQFDSHGASNGSRGVFAGRDDITDDVIQYVTIDTPGNATDFGDMLGSVESKRGMTSGSPS